MTRGEPTIAVGLLPEVDAVTVRLEGDFVDAGGEGLSPGVYRVESRGGRLFCSGPSGSEGGGLQWQPADPEQGRFAIEATIGVAFHWQQQELQSFAGGVRFLPVGENSITVINDVALETYLASVICSEMSATSPVEMVKAHSVVSRSWLLAQCEARAAGGASRPRPDHREGELIRWYDREGHPTFDVCADDHCQRYHGVERIRSETASRAILATRGQVLTSSGKVCDARYAKACGGVTEDFRAAWSDDPVPYLVPFSDAPDRSLPSSPLSAEAGFQEFLAAPSDAYCNCDDGALLDVVLNRFDRDTPDFFRWQVELSAEEASRLVEAKLGLGLGRILALEPVERGLSGRLIRLRLVGEKGERVIGKELEIRRALSPSHLYSSAFVVDLEGPAGRPEKFILRGAGWGHGVGLCQIGAAVMASRGIAYEAILAHYYPGTALEQLY